jgi:hypothetical protein
MDGLQEEGDVRGEDAGPALTRTPGGVRGQPNILSGLAVGQ